MLVLPPLDVLGKEKNRLKALPPLRIEDLLGRDEIKINLDEIRESLKGKVVMVTGLPVRSVANSAVSSVPSD